MRIPRTPKALTALLTLILGASLLASCGRDGGSNPTDDGEAVQGELLISVRAGTFGSPALEAVIASAGDVVGEEAARSFYRIRLHDGLSVEEATSRLRTSADVVIVERNYLAYGFAAPADSEYAASYSAAVQAELEAGWAAYGLLDPATPIVLAVLDTGVLATHLDLVGKVDLTSARNFVPLTPTSDASDDHGHGTALAGIAAAESNAAGVVGVSSWDGTQDPTLVKIMPVKVADGNNVSNHAAIAAGMGWAVSHGANVILLSLGSASPSYTLQKAIEDAHTAGVLVVAAAGNDGTSAMKYPAAYQGLAQRVLSVSSADQADALDAAHKANFGAWVNLLAPGAGLTVTGIAGTSDYPADQNGSSLAAAHVAGAAALLWTAYPPDAAHGAGKLTVDEVRSAVLAGLDTYDRPTTTPIGLAGGRFNLEKAVAAATAIQGAASAGVAASLPGSVVFSATSTRGGTTLTGTVVMTGEAPAAQAVVLTSPDAEVVLPSGGTVTVPKGARHVTFPVITRSVAALKTVSVKATANGVDASGTVDLTAPGAVRISLTPSPVVGGANVAGLVTLAGPAPAGFSVTLTDDNATSNTGTTFLASTISVPQGASSAAFTVRTVAVAASKTVKITATSVGGATSANLVILPVLGSVAFVPAVVRNGNISALSVTLNAPQATDTVVTLNWTDASGAIKPASKPATVTILKNTKALTVSVGTAVIAADSVATVTGQLGATVTASATLSVLTAKVASVAFPAGSLVNWGDGTHDGHVTGTVTLDAPALQGTVLYLTAGDTIVAIPPTTTVATAGGTTATFTLVPAIASQPVPVSILASLSPAMSAAKGATVTVVPALASLALSPAQAPGGATVTGTVTLNGAAPAAMTIPLVSDNVNIAPAPATVAVASGARSGKFTFVVGTVAVSGVVNVSATLLGVTKSATFGGQAPLLGTVTFSPASGYKDDAVTGTVTLTAVAPNDLAITLVSSDTTIVPASGAITVLKGALKGTFTFTVGTVAAQKAVTVTATVGASSKAGTFTGKVMAVASVVLSPVSGYQGDKVNGTVTLNAPAHTDIVVDLSATDNVIVPGLAPITILKNATSGPFSFTTGAVAAEKIVTVTAGFGGTSKTATYTGKRNGVASVTITPTTGYQDTAVTGTVLLAKPALADTVVTLTSGDGTIVPGLGAVTVLKDANSASFSFVTGAVAAAKAVSITGALNGTSKAAAYAAKVLAVASVTFSPASATPGTQVTGTVTLNGAAPSDTTVSLVASDTTIVPSLGDTTVSGTMTVARNATSGTFSFTTGPVAVQKVVTITATLRGASKAGTFTGLTAPAPVLTGVTLDWPSGIAGDLVTITATLSGAAQANTDVTLSAGDSTIVPGLVKVTVPQGQSSGSTTFTTGTVASHKQVTITATLLSAQRTVAFTGRTGYVAFVTNAGNKHTGNFGGLAGADAFCQSMAQQGATHNIPQRRHYVAFLSTSTTNAIDRVVEGQYVLSDGTVVASSKAVLGSGTTIQNPITIDELGNTVYDNLWVFTGSKANGTAYMNPIDATCSNWTDGGTSNVAVCGTAVAGDQSSGWLMRAGPFSQCASPNSIYCFEQPVQKVVFVTSQSNGHDGIFGGLGGADAFCQARADAATIPGIPAGKTWKAFLSSSTVNAKDRITDAQYVLPDGTLVARSKAGLLSGSLLHAIDQDELGNSGFNAPVFTGSTAGGTTLQPDQQSGAMQCSDWTSNLTYGGLGNSIAANSAWVTNGYAGCGNTYSLYCFQQ